MSRWHSYINSAKQILALYKGDKPFALFIKEFFRQHKKYGSGDRKQISHLCYCYFRSGHALKEWPAEERLLAALFLCSRENSELLHELKPGWADKITISPEEKIALLNTLFFVSDIFPRTNHLSDGIDANAFAKSHLVQPDLFLRIRPGNKKQVTNKLHAKQNQYSLLNDDCLVMANNTKVDDLFDLNKEVVVQDYSSQHIQKFLEIVKSKNQRSKITVWDCCAASGGKSLLAVDILQNVELTVSDVRSAIIHNLKKRFNEAWHN